MCILFRSHLVGIPGLHVHQARGPFIQVNASVERKRGTLQSCRWTGSSDIPVSSGALAVDGASHQSVRSPERLGERDAWCGLQRQTSPTCRATQTALSLRWYSSALLLVVKLLLLLLSPRMPRNNDCKMGRQGGKRGGKKEKKEAENTWRCPDYSQLIPQQAIGWERLSVTVGQKQSRAPSASGLLWWEQRQEEGGGVAVRGGDGWGWEQSITGREGGKKKDKSRFTSSYQCLQQDEPIFKVISVGICVKNVLLKKI